MKIAKL